MPEPEPITPNDTVPTGVTNTYPVAVGQAVTGVTTATIAVLSGFEIIDWTPQQWGLVLALVTAIIAAVYAFVSGKVYSPATVAKIEASHKEQVAVALATPTPTEAPKSSSLSPAVTSVSLAVTPPIVAAVYSARLSQWDAVYLRPAPPGLGTFSLTSAAHNGLPVAELRPGGPLGPIGPAEQETMGLREPVAHPDADGN